MKFILCAALFLAGSGMTYADCPAGFTFNTALQKCEIAPACPPGFALHKEDDRCSMKSSDGTCPNGSTYNEKEKTCD